MATNHTDGTNTPYDHDVASEAGSLDTDTLSSQRIYTPTSSVYGAESESHDHEDEDEVALTEQAPLLFESGPHIPVNEKRQATPVHTTIQVEPEESKERKGEEVGHPRASIAAPRRSEKGRKYFWSFLKVIMMLGLAIWLYRVAEFFLTTPRNPRRICHGHVENEKFLSHKREIVVDHGHNSISGKYPLFDLLSLSTTSGNTGVTVMPQPADPRKPDEPARLRIRSHSGSVTVSFTAPAVASLPEMQAQMEVVDFAKRDDVERRDTTRSRRQKTSKNKKIKESSKSGCKSGKGSSRSSRACKDRTKTKPKEGTEKKLNMRDLPPRPYDIDIETESGTISGRFTFSTSVHLSTKSGGIDAILVPVDSDRLNQSVSVITKSLSGSQQVHLTEPVYAQDPSPFQGSSSSSPAQAKHISPGGASMQITYPPQWAGRVYATPDSGSVSLGGHGLKVTRAEDGSVEGSKDGGEGEKWWGGRGNMDVSLGTRGAVMFTVG